MDKVGLIARVIGLLGIGTDAKTRKGQADYLTAILYLAPHTLSGANMCAFASAGCIATCLFTAGRGIMAPVWKARVAKTMAFLNDKPAFLGRLAGDILKATAFASKHGKRLAVRLNGTSDLGWNEMRFNGDLGRQRITFQTLPELFPSVMFYDYTKNVSRMMSYLAGRYPSNVYYVFSRSETNERHCLNVLEQGGNVAVVFSTAKGLPLPATWNGYPVIDGDLSDLRFLDASNVIVGVRAKGKAKHDASGFVVRVCS